jgi:hypothetical protein
MTTMSRVAPALHGDDAVAAAERSVALADVLQCCRHVLVVVGVLVREHQVRGWGDCAGLVAVDLFHLGRPFPPLVGEVEAIPAHSLRRTAGKRAFKSGDALTRAVVVGFASTSPVNLRHSSCTRAPRSDVSLIGPARQVQPVNRTLSRNHRWNYKCAPEPASLTSKRFMSAVGVAMSRALAG